MKIITFLRSGNAVTVAFENNGKIDSKVFRNMTDAEVKAELLGTPKPEVKPIEEPKKKEPEKTIPEPPVIPKERITRRNMIAALEAAGVTDYDSRNRESLTTAYNTLKKKGGK